jgi:hypothetical protein
LVVHGYPQAYAFIIFLLQNISASYDTFNFKVAIINTCKSDVGGLLDGLVSTARSLTIGALSLLSQLTDVGGLLDVVVALFGQSVPLLLHGVVVFQFGLEPFLGVGQPSLEDL